MNRNVSDILDCIEYNPLKTKTNRQLSLERAKVLAMQKIHAEHVYPAYRYRPRRLALAALAALVAVALSGTAFAANTFGVRDLVGQVLGWTVNEAAEVLELDIDAAHPQRGGGSFGGVRYIYTMKSVTLSATGLTFSYAYSFEGGEMPGPPLPSSLQLALKDGTRIDAAVKDYTDENGVVSADAAFPAPVNLADAHYVVFGAPDFGQRGQGGTYFSVIIGVTPLGFPDGGADGEAAVDADGDGVVSVDGAELRLLQ
jgi:hypothetical protein